MEEMFTPEEVANMLKVQKRTVYIWLRQGRLKGVKAGDLWRITESALHDFMQDSTKNKHDE